MRNDKLSVEKIAISVTQLFLDKNIEELNRVLERLGGENNARLIITDANAKVMIDTYSVAEGMLLNVDEVLSICNKEGNYAYGLYDIKNYSEDTKMQYINLSAVGISNSEGLKGVLVFSSSLDNLMNNLNELQNTILKFFALAAIITIILAFFWSGIITRPIAKLTQGIRQMGKGDFSVRVEETGSSEIRNLSATFNNMSERLENLDQTRNQFISNASHELKTPLATTKILIENILYQDDMPRELVKEFLSDINREIDRLNSVVKDLLTLVSLDKKTLTIEKANFNISDLVKDICFKMKLVINKKGKELYTEIQEGIEMYADSAKLHHVFYNILDNALKYTGDDGKIEVKFYKTGDEVIFSVKDNGNGIPEENIKHIFERFYRVDKARSRETGGTGLGLSIANQIVKLHGGIIDVESKIGEGSTFTVRFENKEVKE